MISLPTPEEQRAAQARERLVATLATLQARLTPRALAQDAAQSVIDKGQAVARDGIETVRRHPVGAAGALAAVALFLARRPLGRLLTRREADETPAAPASLNDDRPRAEVKGKSA